MKMVRDYKDYVLKNSVGRILSIFENAARGDPMHIPLRGLPDPF